MTTTQDNNTEIGTTIATAIKTRSSTPSSLLHSDLALQESGGLRILSQKDPILGQMHAQQSELLSQRQVQAYAFSTMDNTHISKVIEMDIKSISECTGMPLSVAQLIFRHFGWSLNNFTDKYFSLADPMKDCGINISENQKTFPFECSICCEEIKETEVPICGHLFCRNCWKDYIKVLINSQMNSDIRCMEKTCSHFLDFDFVKKVSEKEDFERYWYFVIKTYVESNASFFALCPNPKCDKVLNYTGIGKMTIADCSCGTHFCFLCGKEDHDPVTCSELNTFELRASRDDESIKRIEATAKLCPKCKWPTERNQGCNHMTCIKCTFQWCWMCAGDWSTHSSSTGGNYSCTLYDTSAQKKKDENAAKDLVESEMFLEYYNKYFNHNRSAKEILPFRETLLLQWRELIKGIENRQRSDEYVSTIYNAIDLCIFTRKLLGRGYMYLFFHEKDLNLLQMILSNWFFCQTESRVEELYSLIKEQIHFAFFETKIKLICNKTAALELSNKNLRDAISKRFAVNTFDDKLMEKTLEYPTISGNVLLVPTESFDKNGVVYFLGTSRKTKPFANPTTLGLGITCSRSGGTNGKPEDVLNYTNASQWTNSVTNAWWAVNFNTTFISPTHYCLWSDIGSGKPRSWRFEGAKSMSGPWKVLREHTNDNTFSSTCKQALWKVELCDTFYNCFRITQTGYNSDGGLYLTLSAFEVYGLIQMK